MNNKSEVILIEMFKKQKNKNIASSGFTHQQCQVREEPNRIHIPEK